VATLQQKFGTIIRARGTQAGLGQEALADKAGLHRTHISLLERGKRMPTLEVVRKLAAALGTTMAALMEELEAEQPAEEESPTTGRKKRPG
jgi:transcriptional regulator with XRE-family HTH domain